MPPYRRLRMPSSSESTSSESTSPAPTEALAKKRKSIEVKSEMASHDEGDDGDSFSNTRLSQGPSKRKRNPDPPPGATRSIPCLPCIARAVKSPGHQCHDCNANEAAFPNACWHCAYINRHRKTCVELPAETREELMEFWNMNSKLPKDHVRDAGEQANVARINRMLYEYRNRNSRPRSSRGRDSVSQADTPSENFAEQPIARESIATQPFARDFVARDTITREPIAREPIARDTVTGEQVFTREPTIIRPPATEPRFASFANQNTRPVNVMGGPENALAAMIREQTVAMNRQTEVMEGIFASLQSISYQMTTLTTEVRRNGQGRVSAAGQAGNNINQGIPGGGEGQVRDDGMDAWRSEYLTRWKK